MALRNIVTQGDKALSTVCREVTDVNDHIRQLIDDMVDTMRDADGVGLAAPQVGVLRRIFVVEVDGELYELVNPKIVYQEGDQYDEEGCLSVPGVQGMVHRPQKVRIEGLDRNGDPVSYEGEGLLARAFCHENDHLDGILYVSKAENLHVNGEME